MVLWGATLQGSLTSSSPHIQFMSTLLLSHPLSILLLPPADPLSTPTAPCRPLFLLFLPASLIVSTSIIFSHFFLFTTLPALSVHTYPRSCDSCRPSCESSAPLRTRGDIHRHHVLRAASCLSSLIPQQQAGALTDAQARFLKRSIDLFKGSAMALLFLISEELNRQSTIDKAYQTFQLANVDVSLKFYSHHIPLPFSLACLSVFLCLTHFAASDSLKHNQHEFSYFYISRQ